VAAVSSGFLATDIVQKNFARFGLELRNALYVRRERFMVHQLFVFTKVGHDILKIMVETTPPQ
jgi:hypothetical protein